MARVIAPLTTEGARVPEQPLNSADIRHFLDRLEATDLPPIERGRANKAAEALTRNAQFIEIEERSGRRSRNPDLQLVSGDTGTTSETTEVTPCVQAG